MEGAEAGRATVALPILERTSSLVSEASSCRTEGEEGPSSTDTSPAATPPRPSCMAAGEEEEEEEEEKESGDGGGRTDSVSLFKEMYDVFFPKHEEDVVAGDEEASRQQQRLRRRSTRRGRSAAAVHDVLGAATQAKRPRRTPSGHNHGGDDAGLAALPGECLREVASFLPSSDLWPSFALVSKSVSCRPAILPLLLDACPHHCKPAAVFGLSEAAEAVAAPTGQEQQPPPLAPCRDLRTLDLSGLPLGEVGGRRLARVLGDRAAGFPALRSLDLARSGLNGPSVEVLTSALLPHPATQTTRMLESLVLAGNGLGDDGMAGIGRLLREGACPRLQVLDLANTGITERGGVAHLAQAFASGHCSQLRRLNASHNPGLGAAGAALLLAGMRDGGLHTLEELRLRDCGLGPTGVEAVARAFAAGTLACLGRLDLEGNRMGAAGMAALLQGWSGSSHALLQLKHLHLGRNELEDRGAHLLGQALGLLHCSRRSSSSSSSSSSSGGLETLSLPSNALTAEGASAVWAGLEEGGGGGAVRVIDVSHNPMGPEGVRGLARCCLEGVWPRLEDLDLSGTALGDEGVSALATALTTTPAPALRRLLLRDCGVGDPGLVRLAGALGLVACPALEELGLGGNGGMGDEAAGALGEAIERNGLERLRVLDLRGSGMRSEGLGMLVLSCRTRAHALETLDLSGPSADAAANAGGVQALGAYWLSAALEEGAFPRLETLRLSGQGVGRAGLYALHVAARNGKLRRLQTLDLGDNPTVGDAGVGYLAIALRRGALPRLQALDLANCAVGDKGLKHLAHALAATATATAASQTQQRLVRLGLARNAGLTADGVAHLRKDALPDMLQHLDLDGCRRLGNRGLRALLASGGLRQLRTLRVGGTGIGDEGVKALSAYLAGSACRSLESLVLAGNESTGKGAVALAGALATKCCPLLRELEMSGTGVGEAEKRALTTTLLDDAAGPLCRLSLYIIGAMNDFFYIDNGVVVVKCAVCSILPSL